MTRFRNLVDALDEIALHYRLDDKAFIARQYEQAAETIMGADMLPPDPSDLDGIGDAIRDDIAEWRAFGKIPRLESMRNTRPYLADLCRLDGVGPKTAEKLNHELGVETVEDVAHREDLILVSGIGEKTAKDIRNSADYILRHED